MKKLLLTGAAIYLLTGAAAFAEVNVSVDLGGGGGVAIQPAPVIVTQPVVVERPGTYDPHHRDHDRRYWEEKKARERHEREERDRHDHRDHRDDHHDHHDNHDDHR